MCSHCLSVWQIIYYGLLLIMCVLPVSCGRLGRNVQDENRREAGAEHFRRDEVSETPDCKRLTTVHTTWAKNKTSCRPPRPVMTPSSRNCWPTRTARPAYRGWSGLSGLGFNAHSPKRRLVSDQFLLVTHSFMSRTVNSNHQDEMGYTALHYAALNGHRSVGKSLVCVSLGNVVWLLQ